VVVRGQLLYTTGRECATGAEEDAHVMGVAAAQTVAQETEAAAQAEHAGAEALTEARAQAQAETQHACLIAALPRVQARQAEERVNQETTALLPTREGECSMCKWTTKRLRSNGIWWKRDKVALKLRGGRWVCKKKICVEQSSGIPATLTAAGKEWQAQVTAMSVLEAACAVSEAEAAQQLQTTTVFGVQSEEPEVTVPSPPIVPEGTCPSALPVQSRIPCMCEGHVLLLSGRPLGYTTYICTDECDMS
jgi:hypothetical protein